MGIKFHCPNGHKLNVKSFLAGKKGVCPKCGTKVRIPVVSETGLVDSELEETDASQHPAKSNGSGAVAAATLAAPAVSTAPAASPAVSTTVPLSPRSSSRTATRYQEKKRDSSSLAIAILVGLGIVCLVLVAVLVYVLTHLK